jgi:hypothetical protein
MPLRADIDEVASGHNDEDRPAVNGGHKRLELWQEYHRRFDMNVSQRQHAKFNIASLLHFEHGFADKLIHFSLGKAITSSLLTLQSAILFCVIRAIRERSDGVTMKTFTSSSVTKARTGPSNPSA